MTDTSRETEILIVESRARVSREGREEPPSYDRYMIRYDYRKAKIEVSGKTKTRRTGNGDKHQLVKNRSE